MQARPIFLNENDEMHSRDEWIGALTLLSARLPAYHAMAVGRQTIWTYRIDTAGTDGVYIYINPDFFLSLPTASQRAFLIAHEVGHIVASHMARGKVFNDRGYLAKGLPWDNGLYNEAADYIINDDLIAGNLEFIPCALHDPSFTREDVTEEVYIQLVGRQEDADESSDDESTASQQQQGQQQQSGQPSQSNGQPSQSSGQSGDDGEDQSGDNGEDQSSEGASGDDGEDQSSQSSNDGASNDDAVQSGDESTAGQQEKDNADESTAGQQATPHDGHDHHFEPQYDGTPEEIEEAQNADEQKIQREIDKAIEAAVAGGHHVSRGFAACGSRAKAESDFISQDWREKVIDHLNKPAREGVQTWSRIHRRRYAMLGVVTPTKRGALDRLAIISDISYSVDDESRDMFDGLMAEAIDQLQPASGAIVVHTSDGVEGTDEVYNGQEYLEIDGPRGGGTYLSTGLDWLDENGDVADAIIVFTDGMLYPEDAEALANSGALVVIDTYKNYVDWKVNLAAIPARQLAIVKGV